MKTILLTGASGAVGFEAFKVLLDRRDQYKTRIFSLDAKYERNLFEPFQDQTEIIWGDIRNPEDVRKAVEGVDVILHAAGIIPPAADHHPQLAWAVNVGGTKNLVDAIRHLAVHPKLVFTSSISVYGDRVTDPEIQVGDPLRPSLGDEYAQTKIEAESIIRNSGIRWSIFRLCGILVKRLKVQPLMFHMPLDTALEWCHDSDAGYALVQAIEPTSILGKIFNLGGGEQCRVKARDFLAEMFPIWGLRSDILPDYAFATQNFHSGYYADGENLNKILQFRRRTLKDYIDAMKTRISPFQRLLVQSLPRPLVRSWLLKMSEPLKAVREGDESLISRFYGSRAVFERLISQWKISSSAVG